MRQFVRFGNNAMPKMSSSTGALLVRRGIRKSYRYSLPHFILETPTFYIVPVLHCRISHNRTNAAKASLSLILAYTYISTKTFTYISIGSKRRGYTHTHNKRQKFQWRIITDPQHHHHIIHLHHLLCRYLQPPLPHRYRYQEVPWHIRIILKYLSEDYRGKLPKNRYDGTLNNTDPLYPWR
jgi:hypothetical protein